MVVITSHIGFLLKKNCFLGLTTKKVLRPNNFNPLKIKELIVMKLIVYLINYLTFQKINVFKKFLSQIIWLH